MVELELRAGNVEAAREAAEKAIDQIEFCSDDAARMALISAAATAVEAEAADRARDLGDGEELAASQLRAELMAARTEAAADEIGRRRLECAYSLTAGAHLARARGDRDAAERAGAAAAPGTTSRVPTRRRRCGCARPKATRRRASARRRARRRRPRWRAPRTSAPSGWPPRWRA